ncbi:MAG: hypothetical protein RR547_03470 [Raoultibacter sp.]
MEVFTSPEQMKDLGFLWVVIALSVAAFCYFAPTLKDLLRSWPERKRKSDLLIENNTAAFHLCRAALDNNTEALRENKEDRDKNTAILIEHDAKSEIRFQHQSDQLNEIRNKL